MYHNGGLNINLNLANQGIRAGGCCGPRGGGRPRGPQGQMMQMMQMMLQLMSRMMGNQGGGHCCPQHRPQFGGGVGLPGVGGGGFQFQMGASIRGFLG